MKYKIQNPEVLYTDEVVTKVDRHSIEEIRRLAAQNSRKRARLCAHDTVENSLHEMLVVHGRGAYVPPHKHLGKTESTHIIEGIIDVVLFDEEGRIADVIHMGDYASGKIFYYRMANPLFHTLIIRSDVLVFHETTNGPFDPNDTLFAPWAPKDEDTNAVDNYMAAIENNIRLLIR